MKNLMLRSSAILFAAVACTALMSSDANAQWGGGFGHGHGHSGFYHQNFNRGVNVGVSNFRGFSGVSLNVNRGLYPNNFNFNYRNFGYTPYRVPNYGYQFRGGSGCYRRW